MFIQVGYGLEGALPDATAFDITERHIKPLFRAGNFEGGLATGIDLICKATRGEYKGSGKTVAERLGEVRWDKICALGLLAIFVIVFVSGMYVLLKNLLTGNFTFSSGGSGPVSDSGGGSSSGGGGGDSGFSGGGGSFGGGGAGSSW